MLCCPPGLAPDGSFWYASYQEPGRDRAMISVVAPDGTQELVADSMETSLGNFRLRSSSELLFINGTGAVCRIGRTGGVSVLVSSNTYFFDCYDRGILTVPATGGPTFHSIQRRDASGVLLETLEIETTGAFVSLPSGDAVLCRRELQILRVDLGTKHRYVIAGHEFERGCRDGHGTNARFNHLMMPFPGGPSQVFVRDVQPDQSSRLCSVNLATFEVSTVEVRGLEGKAVATCSGNFPHCAAITTDGVFLDVDLSRDVTASTFLEDMAQVDWSEPMEVEFRLRGGAVFRADRRVLRARSEYFAAMLSEAHGLREARGTAVDLSGSPVEPEAFRAVLAYLATDELSFPAGGGAGRAHAEDEVEADGAEDVLCSALFCLKVIALADQYQLLRLVRLAEAFVVRVALPGRDRLVLPFLERTLDTGSPVEAACWDAALKRTKTVLATVGPEGATQIWARNPALATQLLSRIARDESPAADGLERLEA